MALLLLAGAGYAYYKTAQEAEQNYSLDIDLEGKTAITLLPLELTSGLLQSSLSTITFLDGDYVSISKQLQARVDAVIELNPWLSGWIAKAKDDTELKLWYDPTGQDRTPHPLQVLEPGIIPLTRHTKYQQYHDLCSDFDVKVPTTAQLVGKNTPLWKIRVIPDAAAPTTQFAVVVSMSHVLGDAHTFYKLYGMLSTTGDIAALNPIRHPQFHDQAVQRLGKDECYYLNKSNPTMWEKRGDGNDDDPTEILIFTIKNEWLQTRQQELEGDDVDPTTILLSQFFQWIEPTVGFLAHPLRESLPILGDLDAGNYQNPIPYTSMDYATPTLIQESLQTGKRSSHNSQPLPKWSLRQNSTYAFGVDWARFSNIRFGIKHIPLFDTHDLQCIPRKLSGFVLFQVNSKSNGEQQLGAFCVVKKSVGLKIRASGIIEDTLAVV
jgi:hypothetical protein